MHFPVLGWVYPTQLFSSLMLLGIFVVLSVCWAAVYRGPSDSSGSPRALGRPGSVFLMYFWLYGIGRFLMEYVRGDTPALMGGLKLSQWASIGLVIVAAILTWWHRRHRV